MSSLKPTNETQLSLFDVNNSMDSTELPVIITAPVTSNKAPRFLTLSASAHAACFLLISALSLPLLKTEAPEMIEFELDPVEHVAPLEVGQTSLGVDTPATQGKSVPEVPTDIATALPEKEAVVAPAPAKPVATKPTMPVTKSTVAEVSTNTVPETAVVTAPARIPVAAPVAPVLETPELEGLEEATQALATPPAPHQISEGLESELETSAQQVAAVSTEDFKIEAAAAELESLQEMSKLQALESAQIANLQKSTEDSAALARAASEKEAQRKLLGSGQANQGLGAGNNGSPEAGTAVAGSPSGVRSLDQLRQMPNNPRPAYDREERRRGDQGVVAFVAYINKAGVPVNFQLVQSSGFKNLDAKTLAALKKWKFYPGQEGWVELPFRWDLQGGAQEDGGFLRRVGSR